MDEFWSATPRLFSVILNARIRRERAKSAERRWLAWHIAFLPHTKRPPRLDKFVGADRDKSETPQSPEAMLSIAMQWHEMMAGRA